MWGSWSRYTRIGSLRVKKLRKALISGVRSLLVRPEVQNWQRDFQLCTDAQALLISDIPAFARIFMGKGFNILDFGRVPSEFL